jgi:Bax protein
MKSKKLTKAAFFLLFCTLFSFGGCTENRPDVSIRIPVPRIVSPTDHRALKRWLASQDYSWSTLDQGVPPFILKALPHDFDRIPRVEDRKRIFFLSLLPTVLLINDEINQDREALLNLLARYDSGKPLGEEDRIFLSSIEDEYRVSGDLLRSIESRKILLKRLDIVPPSIVLAQAANESGYGTSRFARAGNNLFGEWTFTPGTGLVPLERPEGETYEVRKFNSLYDAVKSYVKNINTHWAYRSLRDRRARMRAEGLPLKGTELAAELKLYSTRRDDYVRDIRSIIRQNRLSMLATVALRPS